MKQFLVAVAAALVVFGWAGQAWAESGLVTMSPATFTMITDTTYVLDVREDSSITPVNAVQVNLSYPSDMVTVENIDASGSGFDVQAEQTMSNGAVRIARGKSGSPLTGNQRIARVTLRAKGYGWARMNLEGGSALVSSASNQNVLATPLGSTMVSFNITTPNPGTPGAPENSTPAPTPAPSPSPTEMPMPSITPSPTATPAPVEESGSTLPETGAMALGGMLGLGATAYSARAWRKSRRSLKDVFKRQPASTK